MITTLYVMSSVAGLQSGDAKGKLTASFGSEHVGGPESLGRIKEFVNRLRSAGASVKIVSTSWYPVTEVQWKQYLFNVTGLLNLGFSSDEILALADPGPGLSADKGAVIQ